MKNDLFIRACLQQDVERTPVWMMRQAGRYMAEYREVRKKHDFWTVCRTPDLATEVTMQPIDKLAPDAAILFSDILVVLPPLGLDVKFSPGPSLESPVRTVLQVNELKRFDVQQELPYVFDALRQIKQSLNGCASLIGFGGAPLTLAAYMVEGGKSKNFENLKTLFYQEEKAAHQMLDLLVDIQADFLSAQIDAGAEAVQIFDTWGGSMPREIIETFVIPKIQVLIEKVKRPGVPVIYFMKDAAHALDLLAQTGADVLSIDDKISLSTAAAGIGPGPALQGNLDSAVLFCNKDIITREVQKVLDAVPKGRGHIFNLGHGILPNTPVENAKHMLDEVKRLSAR
ncbi:MAG: uroporphyrinogen decarboxylase [Deltaproteobacteria bacterium]|nr:uroporphyrinogen decarboxylase [Deltaproteobacteria bacterium]MBN2672367.1 uroporphyrinogen decarboxylase [Deltaproteobacteria bacterium]